MGAFLMQMAHRLGPLLEYEEDGARKKLTPYERILLDALADYAIDPDGITAAAADAGKVNGNPEKTKFSTGRAAKKTDVRPPAQIAWPTREKLIYAVYGDDVPAEKMAAKAEQIRKFLLNLQATHVIVPVDAPDGGTHVAYKGHSRQYKLWVAELYNQYANKRRAEEEALRECAQSLIEAAPPKFVRRAPKRTTGTDTAQETETRRST